MTAKGDNSVKMHFRVIALSQNVSIITDVKFDIKKKFLKYSDYGLICDFVGP